MKLKCRNCGRALGNPLTHRCVSRTDFKRRKSAAGKKPQGPRVPATSPDGKHEYQACTDQDCPRFICRVYKEGRSDGFLIGWDKGYAKGFAEGYRKGYDEGHKAGYDAGFAAGLASCPGPHGG